MRQTQSERSAKYYQREKVKCICPQCGGAINPRFKRLKQVCRKCSNLNKVGKYRAEKSHNWKGGRQLDLSGYIRIYQRPWDAPRERYLLEHHLVWEKANGKPLPEGWVIHHINGIRNDNRIENLYACSRHDHSSMKFYKILQQRIRSLEATVKELRSLQSQLCL